MPYSLAADCPANAAYAEYLAHVSQHMHTGMVMFGQMGCTDPGNVACLNKMAMETLPYRCGFNNPSWEPLCPADKLQKRFTLNDAEDCKSRSTVRRRRSQHPPDAQLCELPCNSEPTVDEAPVDTGDADANQCDVGRLLCECLKNLKDGNEVQKQSAIVDLQCLVFESEASSRAVQLAIDDAKRCDAPAIASCLRGRVREAARSKHANHVIQKILETLSDKHAHFVVEELVGVGPSLARHQFGCRVVCRILEHCSLTDSQTAALFEEILDVVEDLCCHRFGNYVVRHVLEYGSQGYRHRIVCAVRKNLFGVARHKFGSMVVEDALMKCSAEDRLAMVHDLRSDPKQYAELAEGRFGSFVVAALNKDFTDDSNAVRTRS